MKVVLALVLGLVTLTLAEKTCDKLAAMKVKQQWHSAWARRSNSFGMGWGKAFVKTMARHDPHVADAVKARFHTRDEQVAFLYRALQRLNTYLTALDNESLLQALIAHTKERQVEAGVNRALLEDWFEDARDTIMVLIPSVLGRCFDDAAWSACLGHIVDSLH